MTKEEIMHKAGSIVDGMISNNVPSEICNSYYQGFIEGAEWADRTLIEKACEWLDANFPEIENIGSYYKKSFIEQFKKAMEE